MMFLSSLWLWALMIVPAYWWGARRYGWHTQGWLLSVAMLIVLSLARPAFSEKPVTVEESGSDVILAVDVSYSMRGTDISPTRLDAAKRILGAVVRADRRDRFGVLAHTTSAIVLSPLTKDTELLLHLFASLDESQIITKGTNVMSALELARKMSHAKRPLVVLFTDGGDEPSYEKEAAFAAENGLRVCVVILASAQGSTLPADEGSLKDEEGHLVVSSRNDAIGSIAEQSGGRVIEGADASAVSEWIEQERENDFAGSTTIARYQELYYVPLTLALLAFVAAFTRIGEKLSAKLMLLLALIGAGGNAGVLDYPYMAAGKHAYVQGDYERAASWYGRLDSPQARYNHACSLYKAGKYSEALAQFRAIRSGDARFKSRIYYNIGNCQIRLKEFENARNSLLKSLTLRYTKEADDNLRAIAGAEEQKTLNVRKEKNDKFSADENKAAGAPKNSKEGGGSNMQTDIASSGAGDAQKKAQGDPRFSTSQGKAQLGSKQYELINQRSVHETKPW